MPLKLDSIDTVFLVLGAFVPGFIMVSVRRLFTVRPGVQNSERFLAYLSCSMVNYAAFSWLLYLMLAGQFSLRVMALCWFVVFLVGPATLGLIWARLAVAKWPRLLAKRAGLPVVHFIPTAWDWKFGETNDPEFLLITLKNGERFRAYFGEGSFASSDRDERDLYVEQLYVGDNEDEWTIEADGKGALIRADEIAYIEYWPIN